MKKPIKINTNREPLSSDEIKQHQNFKNTWQKQYQKPKPFYKNPKFFGGVVLILITIVVLIIDMVEKNNHEITTPKMEIKPPIKNIAKPADSTTIHVQKPDSASYKNERQMEMSADTSVNLNE